MQIPNKLILNSPKHSMEHFKWGTTNEGLQVYDIIHQAKNNQHGCVAQYDGKNSHHNYCEIDDIVAVVLG